ncbi:C40 family peptidase [Metabacillus niabensis]|uniref:Peptidoglycan hydrolase CwlO-like protein n=1 Tax=Metabacillus niabensis TaxID=324854 RepID=A0ABT9YZH0_9BACI|nr:C40 family peptidase [Metabacillus niabensis]MDQ0225399.1 peptidoglycan hydrolase CwlO-like protein [Metabacillus niabensis]
MDKNWKVGKRMSNKKLVVMNLAVMIGLGSSFAIPSAKAETASEIQQERSQVQANIQNAEQELKKVQEELARLNEQAKSVDQAISENNKKMKEIEAQITAANAEISKLETEIADLEETIKNRTEILKQRAISYQHSGGNVDYLEVLVGSSSFGDFVNRAIAVGKIVEADNELLQQHEADQKSVKEKQAAKVKKLEELTDMKAEIEGIQETVKDQKKQNDELKAKLKDEESAKVLAKQSLEQKDQSLALQESTLKAAEEAAKAAQASQDSQATNSNSSSNSSDNSDASSSKSSTESNSTESDSKSSKKETTVASTPVNPNGTVQDLISAGYKYIGNSVYVFGGGRSASDIANGRFDCSGFVAWAFSTVGVNVGASTDSLKNTGTRVPASQMQPGDMVFFDTYKKDGHVGIYVGGGKFIGSQSSTGVAIANMKSGYWAQKFNGRVMRVNL